MAIHPHSRCGANLRQRGGLTLLEIVVAMALTAVVIGLLSASIHGFLTQLDRRRDQVAGAQLARAVLDLMRRDLQHAFWPPPTGAGSTSIGSAPPAGDAAGDDAGEAGDGTGDDGSGSGTGTEDPSADPATGDASMPTVSMALPRVSFIGSQYELQWDALLSPSWQDVFGDPSLIVGVSGGGTLQTISYYAIPSSGGTGQPGAAAANDGGLVRLAVDRVSSLFATPMAGATGAMDPSVNEQVLASEVQSIEFGYFDGSSWYAEWDSEVMGGLPLAVSVTLTVLPPPPTNRRWVDTAEREPQQFQMVVHLPMASAQVLQQAAAAAAASTTSATGVGGL